MYTPKVSLVWNWNKEEGHIPPKQRAKLDKIMKAGDILDLDFISDCIAELNDVYTKAGYEYFPFGAVEAQQKEIARLNAVLETIANGSAWTTGRDSNLAKIARRGLTPKRRRAKA